MFPNPDLYLMAYHEKVEQFERKNRHRWFYEQPQRRSWTLPKLRHLLFFW